MPDDRGESFDQAEQDLWREVEQAQAEYLKALSAQNAAVADLLIGILSGDATPSVDVAATVRRAAFQRYREATQALHDFLRHHKLEH